MIASHEFILKCLNDEIKPYERDKDDRIASLNEFISLYEPKMLEDKYHPTLLNWNYLISKLKELANECIDPLVLNLKAPMARARNNIKRLGLITEGQEEYLDDIVRIAGEQFDYLLKKRAIERETKMQNKK